MNTDAVARVAVRLLAIWILVSAAAGLAGVIALDRSTLGYGVVAGMSVLGVATQITGAVVLWKYAAWVAVQITAGTPSETALTGAGSARVTQAAVGVLGVFMLSSAIPEVFWYLVAVIASRLAGPSPLAGQPAYEAQLGLYTVGGLANGAALLMRLLLGLFLVFRSSRVSEVVLAASGAAGRPTSA